MRASIYLVFFKEKDLFWFYGRASSAPQKAFQEIKKIISNEVMLKFPDFSKTFEIHTDASDLQLGAVISQKDDAGNNQPIAFFSRKLTPT